jgi:hypothetical protein
MNIKHCFQFYSQMVACGLSLATLLPVPVQAEAVSWTRQLGSSTDDYANDVATDSIGNVYISGNTNGFLGGANQGSLDAWVAKYRSNGALIWKKQLGTSRIDISNGIATDSIGNIYISGLTGGSLGGTFQGGFYDAWVAKYSSNGVLIWKKQLGTSSDDASQGVATDSIGNVYMSGNTDGSLEGANQGSLDAWVAKYSSNGALVWKKQLGTTSYDYTTGVATDSNSNVYISGLTYGSLGGTFQGGFYDAWVAKYSSNGLLIWKKQLGTASGDYSNGVATDSIGNVYISGLTGGSLGGANQGLDDAWVAKYRSNGALVWKKQLGTASDDQSYDIATDIKGNIYISGFTGGSLGGANQGLNDAWVAKYRSNGALAWKKQLGTSADDVSQGVATDSNSNVYISGYTTGPLEGTSQGSFDAWVAKYSQLN